MATLREAERAREQSSEYLRHLGAHAVSVEEAGNEATSAKSATVKLHRAGKPQSDRYAVVAWFDHDPPEPIPRHLEIRRGPRKTDVPLKVRRSERFQPE